MRKRLVAAGLILASAATMMTVNAQNQPTPEQQAQSAVNARKSVVRLFAFNMAAISGMARGAVEFDAAIAERNARRIADLAPMLPEAFSSMDTRPHSVETEALPIIWDRFDEFQQKTDALIQGANTFADIAARGNREETIAAVRAFGSNCGGCHDVFRVQD